MKYKPRSCFKVIHETPWKRCYVVSFRRSGKSYSFAAEMLKRAYNGPADGQYLFISPLAEQTESNVFGMFKGFDDQGYIVHYNKQERRITLANGAVITFGGARTAEKFRGQYLDGCVFDEYSQIPPHVYAEIIQYCLADRDGWVAFIGTARSDDNYRLYRGYLNYKDNPDWLTLKISWRDNADAFTPERIAQLRQEHFDYCLSSGYTQAQAEQAWLCEMECDFSFIDEGRPDMQALFYPELQALFDSNRIIDPTTSSLKTKGCEQVAIFDISHSVDRDYTVAWYGCETTTAPYIWGCEWENNKPLSYWFERLRQLNIQTVALPFDAGRTSKETLLTMYQMFRREGFNIIKIKRLQRSEQVENGRWLLNNAEFSKDAIPALSEVGKFREWKTKHDLPQDIIASLLYAGQVFRKKDIKKLLAEKVHSNYNKNSHIYNHAVSYFVDMA